MEDFPRTLMEFEECFSTEEAWRDYLFQYVGLQAFVVPVAATLKDGQQGAFNQETTTCSM